MADSPSMRKTLDDDKLLQQAIPTEAVDDELLTAAGQQGRRSPKISSNEPLQSHHEHWKRKPNTTGQGAIHVKTFVSKLRLDAIHHVDEQINTWLDDHPEYEVKFVTTSVGNLVGKTIEQAVFINIWV